MRVRYQFHLHNTHTHTYKHLENVGTMTTTTMLHSMLPNPSRGWCTARNGTNTICASRKRCNFRSSLFCPGIGSRWGAAAWLRFNEIGFSFFRPSFWHIERVDIFVFVVLVTQLTGFCDLYGNVSIGGKGVGETATTARGDSIENRVRLLASS